MTKEEIIQNYVGYVQILLDEGEKFDSVEEAVNYAFFMYQQDTKGMSDRNHRFVGNKFLKEELRKELSKLIK